MRTIYVYNGEGTKKVDILISSFKDVLVDLNLFKIIEIKTISAELLQSKIWTNPTNLLIIPGGADLPYVRDIKKETILNIQSFIQDGGSYLGICAGAYFSSNYVCFERGTTYEVTGKRELSIFQGTTEGSVYPGFCYKTPVGSKMASLLCYNELKKDVGKTSHAYFNGGCHFIPDEGYEDYVTLAEYDNMDGKKAIVSVKYGKGTVILSGVHPEIDVKYLDRDNYNNIQWNDMQKYVNSSRKLLRWFLRVLLHLKK